jgi:hypothetical protein
MRAFAAAPAPVQRERRWHPRLRHPLALGAQIAVPSGEPVS